MPNKLENVYTALLAALLVCACDAQPRDGEAWDGPYPAGHGAPAMGEDDEDDDAADPPAREDDEDDAGGAATTGPLDDPPPTGPDEATGGDDEDDEGGAQPPDAADETAGDDPAPEGDPECDGLGFLAEHYTDCEQGEVFAKGCCWDSFADSCEGLGCAEGECYAMTSVPMQAACISHD